MSRFKLYVSTVDLAFLKGLPTGISSKSGLFAVKVPANKPCILDNNHIVISIINPEENDHDKLYAICTTIVGGFNGVYADNMQEALDILADWAQEHAPGLVQTYQEALDDSDGNDDWAQEYHGPVGNEGLYFTERGQSPTIKEVTQPLIRIKSTND